MEHCRGLISQITITPLKIIFNIKRITHNLNRENTHEAILNSCERRWQAFASSADGWNLTMLLIIFGVNTHPL